MSKFLKRRHPSMSFLQMANKYGPALAVGAAAVGWAWVVFERRRSFFLAERVRELEEEAERSRLSGASPGQVGCVDARAPASPLRTQNLAAADEAVASPSKALTAAFEQQLETARDESSWLLDAEIDGAPEGDLFASSLQQLQFAVPGSLADPSAEIVTISSSVEEEEEVQHLLLVETSSSSSLSSSVSTSGHATPMTPTSPSYNHAALLSSEESFWSFSSEHADQIHPPAGFFDLKLDPGLVLTPVPDGSGDEDSEDEEEWLVKTGGSGKAEEKAAVKLMEMSPPSATKMAPVPRLFLTGISGAAPVRASVSPCVSARGFSEALEAVEGPPTISPRSGIKAAQRGAVAALDTPRVFLQQAEAPLQKHAAAASPRKLSFLKTIPSEEAAAGSGSGSGSARWLRYLATTPSAGQHQLPSASTYNDAGGRGSGVSSRSNIPDPTPRGTK